jgi:hypothetical protein
VSYEIPSLLDLPDPTITSYPLESVVAEKLEAIFSIGIINSRMKDFYDLYFISCKESFSYTSLIEAVRCTFTRRGTPFPEEFPPVLSSTVIEDTVKQKQWEAFLKKIRSTDYPVPFSDAVSRIRDFIEPFFFHDKVFSHWDPEQGWKEEC